MINDERLRRDVVLVGASAGGVTALTTLLAGLPRDLPAAIAVVLHLSPVYESRLVHVAARCTPIRVVQAVHGDTLKAGTVYIAPPDVHMRLDDFTIRLDRDPKVHRTRPAIDPLFVSAAKSLGNRVVGVLLSGNGEDGVAGLIAIKAHGGISLVQAPQEAQFPSMPRSALRKDHVDGSYPAHGLAEVLALLARGAPVNGLR
jgi:two-component system chemotaxis response regulator CheB